MYNFHQENVIFGYSRRKTYFSSAGTAPEFFSSFFRVFHSHFLWTFLQPTCIIPVQLWSKWCPSCSDKPWNFNRLFWKWCEYMRIDIALELLSVDKWKLRQLYCATVYFRMSIVRGSVWKSVFVGDSEWYALKCGAARSRAPNGDRSRRMVRRVPHAAVDIAGTAAKRLVASGWAAGRRRRFEWRLRRGRGRRGRRRMLSHVRLWAVLRRRRRRWRRQLLAGGGAGD